MIFLELFLTFFKIGALTFGGGYAMIPLIEAEVLSHGWLELSELIDFIAVSESTPGPFAINIATFIGSQQAGPFGSVCATLGVVMPSFIIILIVANFYERFKKSKAVSGCMSGLRPAVVGMIASAVLSVAVEVFMPTGFDTTIFTDPAIYVSLGIFAVSVFLSFKKLHPIFIVCFSAVAGIAAGFLLG
jgi:chromate transporter